MSTASATLGDMLEAWMMTRPQQQKSPAARAKIAKGAATPEAAAWWAQ